MDGALIPPMTAPTILLEDDSLVALDKPEGLPVSPPKGGGACVMDFVRERFGRQAANVHRLEEDASGVVLCAKTKEALDFLSGQFQSKTVRKTYHALVVVLTPDEAKVLGSEVRGESGMLPGEFAVELNLGEDEHRPDRVRIFRGRGGKPSATQFKVLEPFGRFAWVECLPLTGRMHQIRVHLASVGAPVLNDALYGEPEKVLLLSELKSRYKGREAEKPLLSRLALHATELAFQHPLNRERVTVSSPIPKDLGIALKYLRKFS